MAAVPRDRRVSGLDQSLRRLSANIGRRLSSSTTGRRLSNSTAVGPDDEDEPDKIYMQDENRGMAAALVERKPAGIFSKLRYWRDKRIAKSENVVWLLVFTAIAQTALSACAFYVVGEDASEDIDGDSSFLAYIWAGWTTMTDPGAIGSAAGTARPVAAVFGLCGIFFFAVVLGFIVDAIHENLDAIKKGRCNIVEKDHLLILGWTDACYLLLREVALALEDSGGKTIVVILCSHQSDQRKEMLKRINDVLPLQVCRLCMYGTAAAGG
jgi:hypothetical protein